MIRQAVASFALPWLVAAAFASHAAAQQRDSAAAFDPGEASAAVDSLARLIEGNFIYPEIGNAYVRMLRSRLATGAYARFSSRSEFARAVTDDLQAVHREGHLRVSPPEDTPRPGASQAGPSAPTLHGVGRSGWLSPGVAYVNLHGFSGARAELDRLRTVLDSLSTARTLIIDAREYLGGGQHELDIMFARFFARRTTLIHMDTRLDVERRGFNPFREGETLRRIDGPEGIVRREHVAVPTPLPTALKHARMYVLTSWRTISGGEHFALAMKRTGRATLIGETTAGAGHFGRNTPLGGGYRAFVPVGRPFDPGTGRGWEQTGVKPDVPVPAHQALTEALRRSGVGVEAGLRAVELLPPHPRDSGVHPPSASGRPPPRRGSEHAPGA